MSPLYVLLACFFVQTTFVEGRGKGGCSLRPKPGNCTSIPWWNYNPKSQKCELITEGCPRKKRNYYRSCEICAETCIKQNQETPKKKPCPGKLKQVLNKLRNKLRKPPYTSSM
ncbi:uncharacterized protein LOC119459475 [Dermacentor silvarum]|uniref:uncharacterized protein LOC119459475 n=1 Tax=Dermacentor silvarum TaxID=543639 RepID=UPI0021014B2A|nr:uncharacterized protein LOC119459475 [Dermacentor silvarum]